MTLSCNQSNRNSNNASTANDEWPEITSVLTKRTPIAQTIPTSIPDISTSIAPTFKPTQCEQVSLGNLSENDLASLKQNDPFMYYSIPSVRHATMMEDDVNLDTIRNDLVANPMRRNCVSCPGEIQTNGDMSTDVIVKRRTCISFECHSDMILAELLEESGEDMELNEEDEPEDVLMNLMARFSRN